MNNEIIVTPFGGQRHIDVMGTGHLSRNTAVYFKTLYLALTSTYL
jgi:hypothetical protein